MIIVTKPEATEEQVQHIIDRIKEWGLKAEVSRGALRVVIGIIGPEDAVREKPIAAIPGVASVTPVLKPYKLVARDNADAGLPLSLMSCEGMGMLKDRAYAIAHTEMFAPRYLRHIVGNLQVLGEEPNGDIRTRANYVVIQVLFDRPDAKMHQVGVYYDKFRRVGDQLKLAERRCVYDNLLVDNALCLPV